MKPPQPLAQPARRTLITSALPYVNNAPHLGNIIGCVLSADVFARYCRSRGDEVLYVCGTDEYGTATENRAREEGTTPEAICEKFHAIHKKVYEAFNISFDIFGRTSDEAHTKQVQEMYRDIDKTGLVFEKSAEQTYCASCEQFLADRYVHGTCPACASEDARGDQCDSCGQVLSPEELKTPRCSICNKPPEHRPTTHLYLDLPKLVPQLEAFHVRAMEEGGWPVNARTTTQSWIKRGLQARPITRDLTWGVKVPRPGFENKVFYVWFDAPIGYVSITRAALPDTWQDWWLSPADVKLYQFMAKDNIPFHSVIFPASQLATGKKWTMVHHLSSTEYLNYEDKKFSKSKNIGVFGTDVMDMPFPMDLWRYYLLAVRPEKQDASFSWNEFFDRVNSEFIDNVCNLVNRTLVFYRRNFGETVKETPLREEHETFNQLIKEQVAAVSSCLDACQLREALSLTIALGKAGNRFFQEQEPWKRVKSDPEQAAGTMSVLVHLVRDLAVLLSPFTPDAAERIGRMLGQESLSFAAVGPEARLEGSLLAEPEILFQKLDKKLLKDLEANYGGTAASLWPRIDLRAGKVLQVEPHPDAARLYVSKVDLGEPTPRTIVSGLVEHIAAEDLAGLTVLVAANLKPAKIRGIVSQGMVLTAENRKQLEVITVEATPGAVVHKPGEAPLAADTPVTIDDFSALALSVEKNRVSCDGRPLEVENKPIHTSQVRDGKIR